MSQSIDLKVDWCSYDGAKYAVMHWHYSKTVPSNRNNYIGVWEQNIFIGTIIFGLGASPGLGKPYGLGNFQVSELVRIALNTHKTPLTKILSISIKLFKKKNPNIKLLISFADPYHDHLGVIYQANNWIYTGNSSPGKIVSYNGKLLHMRVFSGQGFNKKKQIPNNAKIINTPPKYRYLYPLTKEIRKQIEPLRKPYPKKCVNLEGDSTRPSYEGGSTPTLTLQNTNGK